MSISIQIVKGHFDESHVKYGTVVTREESFDTSRLSEQLWRQALGIDKKGWKDRTDYLNKYPDGIQFGSSDCPPIQFIDGVNAGWIYVNASLDELTSCPKRHLLFFNLMTNQHHGLQIILDPFIFGTMIFCTRTLVSSDVTSHLLAISDPSCDFPIVDSATAPSVHMSMVKHDDLMKFKAYNPNVESDGEEFSLYEQIT